MTLENYQQRYQDEENILQQLKEVMNRYTYLRAIVFVIFLVFVYINITHLTIPYFATLIVTIIIFSILIGLHSKTKKQWIYHQHKADILKQYIDRFSDRWSLFEENGEHYKDNEDFIAKDLDILGKHSLFQYINVAKTSMGKATLVKSLVRPDEQVEMLLLKQEAVKEIANNLDLSLEIQVLLAETNKKDDIATLKEFLEKLSLGVKPQRYAWPIRLVSLLILILAIMQLFGQASGSVVLLVVLINMLVANLGGLRYHTHFTLVHSISKSLNRYQHIFSLLAQADFKSEYLNKTLHDIKNGHAEMGIRSIYRVSEMIVQRQNVIGNFFLNGVIIYDLLCVDKLASWKKRYSQDVLKWFEQLAQLEAVLSLAIIPQIKQVTCYPSFASENMMLQVKAVSHPLMVENKAIKNDFTLKHQANIITGSNMSGKTTFLRTLGMNMVLAFAGGAICCEEAQLTYLKVLTSMRIEDELSSGTSTFYAELKRIKQMIDESDVGTQVCCFIDEIFKGTNSADRIVGAKAAIERLIKKNVIVFVSTHDFELCDLENTLPISNYHFKEDYQNKQITFDYLIRDGRCHTTNARYLLEMVGIIK